MKIVFMGTPQAAVPSLEQIYADGHEIVEVWTQPDRPSGRGRKMTPPPVKVCAEKLGLTVFQPEKIKTKETRKHFVDLGADIAVVVAYGRILSKTYLESCDLGAVNVHFSLLPKYRGAAPVNWAIVRGEKETGVTTMKMDEGLDTGDILLTKIVEIEDCENSIDLMNRLSHVGAELLSETLTGFDGIVPVKQDEENASFAPMMEKEVGRIDWTLSSTEIVNRIRGFQPFPRSFSNVGETTITFWEAGLAEDVTAASPGEIIVAEFGRLVIVCGDSKCIEITELQVPGKAKMNVRDFLNSGLLKKGDRFDARQTV